MPSAKKHIEQYKHNKELLNEDMLNDKYLDWKITVCFYCAVHLIEKVLSTKSNQHTTSHITRNNLVRSTKNFINIRAQYNTLYNLSITARYNCEKIKPKDITDAMDVLKHIEESLGV